MKFSKGDKVCALLVSNKWGVDFTAFMGRLVRIEEPRPGLKTAKIMVTRYHSLYESQKHKPKEFSLDIKVFKLLKWNEETKTEILKLREASRVLNSMTKKVRDM